MNVYYDGIVCVILTVHSTVMNQPNISLRVLEE